MGSKTKSWLALALAIVMLFGMAVPTAFAANTTDAYESIHFVEQGVQAVTGTYTRAEGLAVGDEIAINMFSDDPNANGGLLFDYASNQDKDFAVAINNPGSDYFDVSYDKAVGELNVVAKAMTTTTVSVDITVRDLNTDVAKFKSSDFDKSKIFTGKVVLSYKPQVTANKYDVTLDLDSKAPDSEKLVLSTNPANKTIAGTAVYKFTSLRGVTTTLTDDTGAIPRPTLNSDSTVLTIKKGSNVTEGDLEVTGLTIDGKTAQPLVIHVKVVNGAAAAGVAKYVSAPATINVKASAVPTVFTANVVDKDGTPVDPTGVGTTKFGTAVAIPSAGIVVTPGTGNDLGKFTVALAANTAEWKGKIVIPAGNGYTASTVNSAVVDVVISPVEMTTTSTLEFVRNLGSTATTITKDVQFYVDGATTTFNALQKSYDIIPDALQNDPPFVITYAGAGKWTVTAAMKDLPETGSGEIEFSNYVNGQGVAVPIKPYKLKYTITDNTTKATVTAYLQGSGVAVGDSGITIDMNGGIPGRILQFKATGSPVKDAKNKVVLDSKSWLDDYGIAWASTGNGLDLAIFEGERPGVTSITVTGAVDGVPFEKEIKVTITNSKEKTPNKIRVTSDAAGTTPITSIDLGLDKESFTFYADLLDKDGKVIPVADRPDNYDPAEGFKNFTVEPLTVYGEPHVDQIIKVLPAVVVRNAWGEPGESENKFTVQRAGDAVGKAQLVVRYYIDEEENQGFNDANVDFVDVVQYVVLNVTVGKATITVTPDKLALNLGDKDEGSKTVTITSNAGTNLSAITLTSADNNVAKAVKQSNGVYKIVATGVGTTKLTAAGKVNDLAVSDAYVDVEVTNTLILKSDKTELNFNLAVDTEKSIQPTITCNKVDANGDPVAVTITNIVIDPTTALTMDEIKANTTFTAQEVSQGTITYKGKVGALTAELVLPFTVINTTKAPVVTVLLDPSTILVGGKSTVSYTVSNGKTFDAEPTISIPVGNLAAKLEGKELTGLALGTAVVTVAGKIDGKDYSGTATLTVASSSAGEAVAIVIYGKTYPLGTEIVLPVTPNESSLGTLVDKDGNVVSIAKILDYVYSSTPIYTAAVEAKPARARAISNKIFAADIRDGVFYFKAKSVGYWMVELELSNGKTSKIYFKNVDENATSVTIPEGKIPTLHAGERFDLRGALEVTPVTANKNKLTYKVQKNGVLSVTVTGILKAQKAGTAKVQVLNSKKTKVLATVTVKVDEDYRGINFASAYFFQDNNTDKQNVINVLNAAKFSDTSTTIPAVDVSAPTVAAFKAKLTALAAQFAGVPGGQAPFDHDDIFTFYFSGNVDQKGIKFSDGVVTFDELAVTAGQLPCRVFMIFDCDYAGSFIAKGSIQNAAFKAIAKQNAAYAKTVGSAGNGKAKIHLLLATSTIAQSVKDVPETGAQKELTKAFVDALTQNALNKELGMGVFSVNLYNLRKEINRTADTTYATIGMYPLPKNGDNYPIYAVEGTFAAN